MLARATNRLRGFRPQPLITALQNARQEDRYFAGHFGFGVHDSLPSPARYVTFLRDPVKRLISLYEYSRETPGSFYFKHAQNRSFREFIKSHSVFETDNGMVRFLLGDLRKSDYFICRKPFGSLNEADVSQAIDNLKTHFAPPGITEQFDRSLLLLQHALDLPCVQYLKLNERGHAARIGTEWDASLDDYVRLDRQLYQWALAENERAWNAMVAERPAALQEFETANLKYRRFRQKPYDVYFRLKDYCLYR